MPRYIILNNILSPYRTALFDALHAAGFDFAVFYMRETEADRRWKIDPATLRHPAYIDRGFYRMLGRYHLHINPRLLAKMLRAHDSEFIVAGGWNDVDVLVLAALKRIGLLRNRIHFWSEANYLTTGSSRDNAIKRVVRKFVYGAGDGATIIPGKMSRLTFERWDIRGLHYVELPNTIDEGTFRIGDADVSTRRESPQPTFVLPARLVESTKGILNFFQAIGDENVRRAAFLLAGDGPDEAAVREYVASRDLGAHIHILGFCEAPDVAELYRRANAFVLPSFSDPSPLALVEALMMRLPVLVSNRCGNHWEAVRPGENGLLFDPMEPRSIREAFETFMRRRTEWEAFGDRSGELYQQAFAADAVIERFIAAMDGFAGATVGQ